MRSLAGGLGLALAAAACLGGDDGQEALSDGQAAIPDVVGWNTNWSKRTIDLGELTRGLPFEDPRDRIPPLDSPRFEMVTAADQWLEDREPVVLLELGQEVRAYPLRILTWHEIVNDQVGDTPVAVTYCPLCNTAIAFERRLGGQVLRFGTSGFLRFSDLVMWDRQTESLWQQITGEAIVGDLAGSQLQFLPSSLIPWGEFKERFPQGMVLSRNTGFAAQEARYGQNPYWFYTSSSRPFLFKGELDDRFPAMERVVAILAGDTQKAYPFSVLEKERVVNDEVEGLPIVVMWGLSDTADPLDEPELAQGQAIGVGVAYERRVNGRLLTFGAERDDAFVDNETGSLWNLLGQALEGPLKGQRLPPVVHGNHLWFAWAAFNPDGPVYEGSSR